LTGLEMAGCSVPMASPFYAYNSSPEVVCGSARQRAMKSASNEDEVKFGIV
jgi:hypothetical protein